MSSIHSILTGKSATIHAIGPDTSVLHAVRTMCTHRIGALLVTTGGQLVGILSERDIMIRIVLAQRDPATTTAGDVMTRDVVCIDAESETVEAMALMTERR